MYLRVKSNGVCSQKAPARGAGGQWEVWGLRRRRGEGASEEAGAWGPEGVLVHGLTACLVQTPAQTLTSFVTLSK